MKILVSKSNERALLSEAKGDEYEIKLKVRDHDTLRSVLGLLTQMNKDSTDGHGSMYVADQKDDGETEHYIDGDGAAYVGDIKLKRPNESFRNVVNSEWLKRGKWHFVNAERPDGSTEFNVRPGNQVIFEKETFYIYYSYNTIYLAREPIDEENWQPEKVEHNIPWSKYIGTSYKTRNKMFKFLTNKDKL